jgi:hypothetical protein
MTQAISKPDHQPQNLYESDLNLWLERTIDQLKASDLDNLDITNLIEELEGLAGRDKRELKSRLRTLLEHLLKRCYVPMPREFNGWERTIREQRRQIKDIIKQSPSLRNIWIATFDEVLEDALDEVRQEAGYKAVNFPSTWQFSCDIEVILNVDFWADK